MSNHRRLGAIFRGLGAVLQEIARICAKLCGLLPTYVCWNPMIDGVWAWFSAEKRGIAQKSVVFSRNSAVFHSLAAVFCGLGPDLFYGIM